MGMNVYRKNIDFQFHRAVVYKKEYRHQQFITQVAKSFKFLFP